MPVETKDISLQLQKRLDLIRKLKDLFKKPLVSKWEIAFAVKPQSVRLGREVYFVGRLTQLVPSGGDVIEVGEGGRRVLIYCTRFLPELNTHLTKLVTSAETDYDGMFGGTFEPLCSGTYWAETEYAFRGKRIESERIDITVE
jgi:hypothetical protein